MEEKTRIHSRVTGHKGIAAYDLGPLHEGFNHIFGKIHKGGTVHAGIVPKPPEHGAENFYLRISRHDVHLYIPALHDLGKKIPKGFRKKTPGVYSKDLPRKVLPRLQILLMKIGIA
jgi:hypothetical protein